MTKLMAMVAGDGTLHVCGSVRSVTILLWLVDFFALAIGKRFSYIAFPVCVYMILDFAVRSLVIASACSALPFGFFV